MFDTSENNKRIAKNTLLLYFRMFFIMAVHLFTSRVILRALGIVDFGIYNVVGGVVAMMGILNNAMAVSTQRYLTFELVRGDDVRLKQVFSICFTIFILLSVIVLVFAETVGLWFLNTQMVIPAERMTAANWVYQFSVISCINTILMTPYNAVIIAHEKMGVYAYVSVLEVVQRLLIYYGVIVSPFDHLITYAILFMSTSLTVAMIYRIYCIRHCPESRYAFYWDRPLFLQLTSYSGWNLFGALSGLVRGHGLNILLNLFFSPAVNAARGIASQVDSAIAQFFTNFYTAVRPQITKYYAQNDLENMFRLVIRSSKFTFFLIFLIAQPILVETPFVIGLWLGQLPEYVVGFTRIIVITSAIDSMASPLMTTCHATGRIRLYQSVVGTLVILNFPVSYVVLKYMSGSPITVFYVSLAIAILAFFTRLWIVNRLVDFPVCRFLKEAVLRVCAVGALASIPPLLFAHFMKEGFWTSVSDIILCLVSAVTFIWFSGMTKGERTHITEAVMNKIRKI
ncbi:MAG: lipopolysaccharide biosynthesis protein [Paraprevotella sp.]|nr:lipopolysaccharide biosynthesis protein [Paraprevotella sp.]